MESSFGTNYRGETDIRKVLDLSRLKDDVEGLIEEMVQQPAVYAYWANLRRIADDKYDKYLEELEIYKSTKVKTIVEMLSKDGVKTPTGKLIESRFHKEYSKQPLYMKYTAKVALWKNRRDTLIIIEKAVESREKQFRSLSYLMSNMMTSGLLPMSRLNSKTRKIKE